ncbi:hypothetical protein WQ54_23190 [Bacillus sp. SA1-12]|uniref:DUF2157 domain-containing protein n=1 Tax=Bacillus sp. SA1-12 TaxID=1455638 RepID=UPI000627439E|nr:DUF2157 domain-containing protein [Bacillus sp. SA1-12]KKI90031.1 hypothetical protein WQ54_23190 [Bacillus sp. SA1-12]
MKKRKIKNNDFQILQKELRYLKDTGVLSSEKTAEITDLYEVKKRLSFTKVLLYIGSILIGIGFLSFIASNWQEIGKMAKFILIIGLYIGCNVAGYKLERNFPKTSRSFYFLSVFVYGAGIFLIGQMFHFGGDFQDAFLWWSIGIIPLSWVLRDKWILSLSALFSLIYMSHDTFLSGESIPFVILPLILAIYFLNVKISYSRITGFLVLLMGLVFFGIISINVIVANDSYFYFILICYFIIGLGLVYAAHVGKTASQMKSVFHYTGHALHGLTGFALTFSEIWPAGWVYIPFSILYVCFVLYLINKGNLVNIVIMCVLILRFYFDFTFDFLPKSLVFILGGLLLVGFGFYFENQRRKGGELHE